jgi:hypothetical protein
MKKEIRQVHILKATIRHRARTKMLAIRLVICTLSRRSSPIAKKRSSVLSLNDLITP